MVGAMRKYPGIHTQNRGLSAHRTKVSQTSAKGAAGSSAETGDRTTIARAIKAKRAVYCATICGYNGNVFGC
uniref:Uncharacterized protein n=1 Tax=mine drainage metagenome TaxID=410659 RepID=E6Q363_9ZZZZ